MTITKVKTATSKDEIYVPITSADKPEIPEELQKKWQNIVDLSAKLIGVPSGLINRITSEHLEVFLSSKTEGNIFTAKSNLDLKVGWYCEHVIGTREELILPNALKDENWKDNPSIPFNIISYLGFPILWPDGEIFGTFCMLDNKENPFSELYRDLLISLREIIQNDLNSIMLYRKAQNDLLKKEFQIREIHHRVKNHFNLIINRINLQTLIGSENSIDKILQDIQSRIFAISSIHDKLYHSRDLEKISLSEYLNELGSYIIQNLSATKIIYDCSGDTIPAGASISVTCGLVLTELLTNSVKYAFEKTKQPKITLKIMKNGHNEYSFLYKDNGCGIAENFNPENSESLGILLIQQSVLQLQGKFTMYNDNGFVFQMNFKSDN